MSHEELALRSGVPRETICRLCTGSRKVKRPSVFAALAWALEVEVEALADLTSDVLPLGPHANVPITASAVGG